MTICYAKPSSCLLPDYAIEIKYLYKDIANYSLIC